MLEHIITNPEIYRHNKWFSNHYNINKMAVHDTPNGIVTSHVPGEVYTPDDKDQLNPLPPYKRDKAHENLLTGQYVDKVYQKFLESIEGKEFINYLKKNGNGKGNPGKLEEILVVNKGEGLVAATMPDYVKSNIIINADYIDAYCSQMSSLTGLSYDDILTNVLVHELNHYFGQTKSELNQPENRVEFDNDSSLIEFYMDMAKKYPEDSDRYVRKAEAFTQRYQGKDRDKMDDYIAKNAPEQVSELEEMSMDDSYRYAA